MEERTLKRYRIPKSMVLTGLGIGGSESQEWRGGGIESRLIATYPATYASGPVGNWETETQEVQIYPFTELRTQFLPTIPLEVFVNLQASFDSTYLWFDLGRL